MDEKGRRAERGKEKTLRSTYKPPTGTSTESQAIASHHSDLFAHMLEKEKIKKAHGIKDRGCVGGVGVVLGTLG